MKHVKMTVVVTLEEGGHHDDSKEGVTETVATLLAEGAADLGLFWTFEASGAEESWS